MKKDNKRVSNVSGVSKVFMKDIPSPLAGNEKNRGLEDRRSSYLHDKDYSPKKRAAFNLAEVLKKFPRPNGERVRVRGSILPDKNFSQQTFRLSRHSEQEAKQLRSEEVELTCHCERPTGASQSQSFDGGKPLTRICKFAEGSLTNSSLSLKGRGRKIAFTLAEVLITLGIIGVVAAMTLPTLIANYQKHVTVNRLKQTYSILYQAIRMSENENGLLETWDIPNTGLGSNTYTYGKTFFEQYLKPYIKVVKECKYLSNECWADEYIRPNGNISSYSSASSNHTYTLVLSNGSVIGFWLRGSWSEIYVDLNGKKGPNKYGKDFFIIIIAKTPRNDYAGYFTKSGLYMYGQGKDRTELISGEYGCSKTATTYAGTYCGALIMHDNWKIAPDYPW